MESVRLLGRDHLEFGQVTIETVPGAADRSREMWPR